MQAERYIAAADIGTSKIALCVAQVNGDDVQVIYYRETPSRGMRYGSVFAPKQTADALKEAIGAAEDELKIRILQLVVGLPRYNVVQEIGSASINRDNPEESCITSEEISDLKRLAIDSYPIDDSTKEEIYGAVAQSFSADDEITGASENDIVGVPASVLEGNFKIFIGARRPVSNIDIMLNEIGIAPARKLFTPNATAQAVLTDSEKENGVALIEIGAGVTSVTIFTNGLLRHYSSIPFGGKVITSDIKYVCSLTEPLAENIKLAFGACLPDKLSTLGEKILRINDDESGSYETVPVSNLSRIITARMNEITEAVLYQIQQSGYADKLRNGVVITGGGANLRNLPMMIRDMSGYTVRVGYPRTQVFSSGGCPGATETSAATVIGMILEARKDRHLNCILEARTSAPATETTAVTDSVKASEPAGKEQEMFGEGEIETVQSEGKKKKEEKKVLWKKFGLGSKIKKGLEGAFDNTVGGLFDDMQ